MRAINASILFDVFRQAWHNLLIDGNTIKIEPKPGVDVVQLQEKLQTLLSTGYISLTSLKEGILYTSPSFQSYVDEKKLKNGSIDQKANVTDFTTYLTDLKQSGSTNGDIDYLLANSSQLNGVNMQTAIYQYQDLGQVGDWATKNPQEAK